MLAYITTVAPLLEAGMLVCFGVSWPVDILKQLRTRRTEGKSLGFLWLILVGYISGLVGKWLRALYVGAPIEWVAWLYLLNGILVGVDIALYLRFRSRSSVATEG